MIEDEKDFEEWFCKNFLRANTIDKVIMRLTWCAARRMLREKMSTVHDVAEFYREKEEIDG